MYVRTYVCMYVCMYVCRQVIRTYPVLLPYSCELALLLLLFLLLLREVDGQGLALHLRQQALLHQGRLLEARVTVHLHQLVDLQWGKRY